MVDEGVDHRHRLVEQAAGIVAQVEDVALELVAPGMSFWSFCIAAFRPS